MQNKYIDLRSDTVSQPPPLMRRAMAAAEVGEDLHGEDPTVTRLETRVASLLGMEAALFVPTGTLGNLIAMKAHTQPGEEVVLELRSHIYECELAGLAGICGLLARPLQGDAQGTLQWDQIRPVVRRGLPHRSDTGLICLENTHNFAGGTVPDLGAMADVCRHVHDMRLSVHLDGARLFNAAVATGETLAVLAKGCDSIMLDFAKGLAAPAGAALAGAQSFITRARKIRKYLGGAIHQPGCLAAACLYGLEHLTERLVEDHTNARNLAEMLAELPSLKVRPERVRTNIVMATMAESLDSLEFCRALKQEGVLVNCLSHDEVRLVTHLDITEKDIVTAGHAIQRVVTALTHARLAP